MTEIGMIANRLNKRCEELQKENDEMRRTISSLKEKLDDTESDISELEMEHRMMRASNERLEDENRKLHEGLGDQREKIEQLSREKETLIRGIKDIAREHGVLFILPQKSG